MTEATYPAWVQDAVFYQIFPERFANGNPDNDPPGIQPWGSLPTRESFYGGDLQGILDRLPYLIQLGITGLYLTPVFAARTNHKYDASDYLAVDPAFGTTALLRHLVHTCHRNGIRVVLDAVFNHCGDGFWAFQDVIAHGPASPYSTWFQSVTYPVAANPPTYQTCGGAAFLPKLNLTNPAVREHLLHVARYWIETCDIDGWRLDVPWKAPIDFWREFRTAVKAIKPDAYIAAETWRDTTYWLQGDTCDGVMNYPLRDYILDYCVRDNMDAEDFDHFATRLRTVQGRAGNIGLNLLGSHDTPRLLTLCGGNVARAKLAYTLQFTLPGAPMIYYGDEVGLLGENDPDCRRTMPWDAEDWNTDLLATLRTLIRVRRSHAALRCGAIEPLLIFNGLYAFRRSLPAKDLIVVINPRQPLTDVQIPYDHEQAGQPHRTWRDLLTGRTFRSSAAQDGTGSVLHFKQVPAQSAFVLVAND